MTRGGRVWRLKALGVQGSELFGCFLLEIYPGSRVSEAAASDNDVFLHVIFGRKNSPVPPLEAQNTGRTEAYTP